MTNSQEIVQLMQIENIKRLAHQIVNHHFNHQSKRHRLRLTIQKNVVEHTRHDHRDLDQR